VIVAQYAQQKPVKLTIYSEDLHLGQWRMEHGACSQKNNHDQSQQT
jgi:hypothetical protein